MIDMITDFKCDKCGKTFSSKGNKNKHMNKNICNEIIDYVMQSTKEEQEQKRIQEEQEQERIQEEQEQKRIQEEQERKHIAEQKRIQEEQERQRIAEKELQQIAEQKRITEEKERQQIAEQKRITEEQERKRIAEQKRITEEQERQRIAEQKRITEEKERQHIKEQKRLAEEKERQRKMIEQKEKEIKEQDEKRRQIIKNNIEDNLIMRLNIHNHEIENEKNIIKEKIKYYENEMKELENIYNENIIYLESELKKCCIFLENESINEAEHMKISYKRNVIITLKEKEKNKYLDAKEEVIKKYNETLTDNNNLYLLKKELLDVSETFQKGKLEKINEFEDALLHLKMMINRRDKNKRGRTEKNKITDLDISSKEDVRVSVRDRMRLHGYTFEEKQIEKPKLNIELHNVYDDIKVDKAERIKNISIIANNKRNKTLKKRI